MQRTVPKMYLTSGKFCFPYETSIELLDSRLSLKKVANHINLMQTFHVIHVYFCSVHPRPHTHCNLV